MRVVCVYVRGGAGGRREGAYTELKTKTPHVNVGKARSQTGRFTTVASFAISVPSAQAWKAYTNS